MKLTDERINELWVEHGCDGEDAEGFARAIEAEVLRLNGGGGEAVGRSFAVVPLKLTREMEQYLGEEDWEWPELLAIAGAMSEEEYDRALELEAAPQPQQAAPSHASDCATHNAPAYPAGSCDCLPTPDMCRAAVEYMNGADVYDKVPSGVTKIEEGIYREVWLAMQKKAPQQTAPVAVPNEPLKLLGRVSNHPADLEIPVHWAVLEGWQPIETAPKDMAARIYRVNGYAIQGFVDAAGIYNVQNERGEWRKMRGIPTHWMPLPAAPSAPKPQGE